MRSRNVTSQGLLILLLNAVLVPLVWADVFPLPPTSKNHGAHQGIYMVLRDVSDPALSNRQISAIRDSEELTRQFYSTNSGGIYDIQYKYILDVPLTLDSNGRRPEGWRDIAKNYVQNSYGINPGDYHLNLFDVSGTTTDLDQGWSGLAWVPGSNIAVQPDVSSDWGQTVVEHELGHRIGAPHSGAYRVKNNSDYTSYVWNDAADEYEVYDFAIHGHQATTYGVEKDEYGNPFSTMGNISREHHNVHTKLTDYGWLDDDQVPDLGEQGDLSEGTVFRIYAHDELVQAEHRRGDYGVVETYDENSLYGLTYNRQAERYNPSIDDFENYEQTITLEYRSGRDGVQFYLGHDILDLDSEGTGADRNNRERELEVGQSISDIDFGMSLYVADGKDDDFLSYSPPAPSDPSDIASEWFEFDVLGTATDLIGNYIELSIRSVSAVVEYSADFNNDGMVDAADYTIWRDHLGDDRRVTFEKGDANGDGEITLDDYDIWVDNYGTSGSFSSAATIPEPSGIVMLLGGCLTIVKRHRWQTDCRS